MEQKTDIIKRIVSQTFDISKKNQLNELIDSLNNENVLLKEKLEEEVYQIVISVFFYILEL